MPLKLLSTSAIDRAGARLPGGGDGNENATLTMSFVIKQSHVGIDENTFSPGSFE